MKALSRRALRIRLERRIVVVGVLAAILMAVSMVLGVRLLTSASNDQTAALAQYVPYEVRAVQQLAPANGQTAALAQYVPYEVRAVQQLAPANGQTAALAQYVPYEVRAAQQAALSK
jgi:hypothetical protein